MYLQCADGSGPETTRATSRIAAGERIDDADAASFPASDAPGWTPGPPTEAERADGRSRCAAFLREHEQMRTLLELLDAELVNVAEGGAPDYQLMVDVLHYMTTYIDRFHHPREEAAFALSAMRDAEFGEALEMVSRQHGAILSGGGTVRDLLERAQADVPVARDAVVEAGQRYASDLRSHLDFEETSLYPVVGRVLDGDDWQSLDAGFQTPDDPLFGAVVDSRYRYLFEKVSSRG